MLPRSLITTLILLAGGCAGGSEGQEPRATQPIVGIDHIPTAVADLDAATETYRRLGFALKPGRLHANGLINNHVKFEDGSGIELISPSRDPTDALSTHHSEHVTRADGPAYFMLHARDMEALTDALDAAGFSYSAQGGPLILQDSLLDFLFFGRDNRSPTDRPEHFAHPNSAVAMTEVWLALNEAQAERFGRLLTVLGAPASRQEALAPDLVEGEVFDVQNGRIVVVPERHRLLAARPIIGAEFQVADLARTACYASQATTPSPAPGTGRRCVVSPAQAHGLWLAFHE